MRGSSVGVQTTSEFKPLPFCYYYVLPLLLAALIGCWPAAASAAQVTLQWDHSEGALGYKLHYGNQSAVYDTTIDVGPGNQYTLAALDDGRQYYFAVSAYNEAVESGYSEELVHDTHLNQPPVADAGPDKSVGSAVAVTLDGSNSSDPDDGVAELYWQQIGGTPVALSNPQEEMAGFTAPQVNSGEEVLEFRLVVQDYAGLVATDTCRVVVAAADEPPPPDPGGGPANSPDTVQILDANYNTRNDKLTVTATSDAAARQTVLTVWAYLGGSEVLLGDLSYVSRKNSYAATFRKIEPAPSRIIVTSSAGGMSTTGCNIR